MTEDRSLSSFLETGSEPSDDLDEPTAESERDDASTTGADDGIEPATSTYGWGEYVCAECGESTARVWCEDDRKLCPSCKQW